MLGRIFSAETLISLLGKNGLKSLVNALAQSDLFKDFIKDLLVNRVKGLEAKYPESYTAFVQYAGVVSELPAILTDEDANNVEQIAVLLQFRDTMKKLSAATGVSCTANRSLNLK